MFDAKQYARGFDKASDFAKAGLPTSAIQAIRDLMSPFGVFDTVNWFLDRACMCEKHGDHKAASANLILALWREEVEQRVLQPQRAV